MFIVCICNTSIFKLIPLLCTHVYSYMFSIVHPPRVMLIYSDPLNAPMLAMLPFPWLSEGVNDSSV